MRNPHEIQIFQLIARTASYKDDAAFARDQNSVLRIAGVWVVVLVALFIAWVIVGILPAEVIGRKYFGYLGLACAAVTVLPIPFLHLLSETVAAMTPVGESGRCQEALDLVNSSPLAARVRDDVIAIGRQLHGRDIKTMELLYRLESDKDKALCLLVKEDVACKLLYKLADTSDSAKPTVPASES